MNHGSFAIEDALLSQILEAAERAYPFECCGILLGSADGAVKYTYSRDLVDKVRELGNGSVKFTTYPGAGHDVWTRTYANPELYEWFLSKKLEK